MRSRRAEALALVAFEYLGRKEAGTGRRDGSLVNFGLFFDLPSGPSAGIK